MLLLCVWTLLCPWLWCNRAQLCVFECQVTSIVLMCFIHFSNSYAVQQFNTQWPENLNLPTTALAKGWWTMSKVRSLCGSSWGAIYIFDKSIKPELGTMKLKRTFNWNASKNKFENKSWKTCLESDNFEHLFFLIFVRVRLQVVLDLWLAWCEISGIF